MADESFDKKMRDVDWAEVYDRQVARSVPVSRYCDMLGVGSGDDVLELGCGPGHTTGQLADHVAPGTVYALDRRLGALSYLLAELPGPTGGGNVRPIAGDAESLPLEFVEPIPTVAAFVLHHADAPERVVEAAAVALPRPSPFLIVEYHPEGGGDVGPPTAHRLSPAQIETWLSVAGFTLDTKTSLAEEKYALLSHRSSTDSRD